MCTCFAEGRCKAPPFPREDIYLDEEFTLHVRGDFQRYVKLRAWMHDACPHPRMEIASERIGNWSMYRSFQHALRGLPAEEVPVLLAELPNLNGGLMMPISARRALEELQRFRRSGARTEVTVVLDGDDGTFVNQGTVAYAGVFVLTHEIRIGAMDGVMFIETRDGTSSLRARRVRQDIADEAALGAGRRDVVVRFTDLDGDATFECHTAVGIELDPDENGVSRSRYPKLLCAERRFEGVDVHAHVMNALETVFRAAVLTGNPVRWC